MPSQIHDSALLFQEITGLPLHILQTQEDHEHFCAAYRFNSAQNYLTPTALDALYRELKPEELVSLRDCFHLRFIFAVADGVRLAFGPYCTELITENDLWRFPQDETMKRLPATEYMAFRSRFPVMEVRQVLRYAHIFLRHVCSEEHSWTTSNIDQSASLLGETENEFIKNPAEVIEERYRIEQAMVEHIKAGRANAAVECYLAMEQSVAYVKRIGNTLERARIGAAITRTTVRHAAFRAGLPAILVDKLSSVNTSAVGNSNDIQEINQLVQDMIRNFCSAIYQKKNNNYGKLILCMIYTIEHEFHHDLSVGDLAEELGVSVDYLIKRCKAETGITPNAYIRKVRMERAALMLRESPRSVREISAEVGILDANYFVKLFKQEFGQTPSAYRAERLL